MNTVIKFGWTIVVTSLLFMIVGHFGSHDLSWTSSQISTYAATSPLDYFVTTAMLLSALSLLIVGLLASKYKVLGNSYMANIVPALSGAAASGLVILTLYEETAPTRRVLRELGFRAVRVQSFHDAGLQIFFYSSLLLVILTGILCFISSKTMTSKILSGVLFGMGPLSFFLSSSAWPRYLGFQGGIGGLKQRAGLFCLWLAVVLFLKLVSDKSFKQNAK